MGAAFCRMYRRWGLGGVCPRKKEINKGMADTAPNGFEPEVIAFCCEH